MSRPAISVSPATRAPAGTGACRRGQTGPVTLMEPTKRGPFNRVLRTFRRRHRSGGGARPAAVRCTAGPEGHRRPARADRDERPAGRGRSPASRLRRVRPRRPRPLPRPSGHAVRHRTAMQSTAPLCCCKQPRRPCGSAPSSSHPSSGRHPALHAALLHAITGLSEGRGLPRRSPRRRARTASVETRRSACWKTSSRATSPRCSTSACSICARSPGTHPVSVLDRLMEAEAVHEIHGWEDLRHRLAGDQQCFGFFHPALPTTSRSCSSRSRSCTAWPTTCRTPPA